MKRKLLLSVLLMWTVSTARSQDTIAEPLPTPLDLRPVSFPFWMTKQIALDLEEKQRLETDLQLMELQLQGQRSLVLGLEKKEQQRLQQIELLEKNQQLLKVQLEGARAKAQQKGIQWIWMLRLLAALGSGFVLGRL